MTITTFNKPALRVLREDLDAALEAVAMKHGIELELGNIRFDASSFTAKVSANTKAAANAPAPTSADGTVDLQSVAFGNVLPESLRGRKFRAGTTTFTLTGVKSSRRKYPFSAEGPKGGRYKFSVKDVQNGLI